MQRRNLMNVMYVQDEPTLHTLCITKLGNVVTLAIGGSTICLEPALIRALSKDLLDMVEAIENPTVVRFK